MTANHEHTPTTEAEIREDFSNRQAGAINRAVARENFDHMIAAAEQRGAERALREARSDWFQYADAINDTPSKYYPALWLNNRADRLEGDDG